MPSPVAKFFKKPVVCLLLYAKSTCCFSSATNNNGDGCIYDRSLYAHDRWARSGSVGYSHNDQLYMT